MDVFYPVDEFEVFRQMMAFFCWAWGAHFGWRFARWQLEVLKEFFAFLRQLLHRPRR